MAINPIGSNIPIPGVEPGSVGGVSRPAGAGPSDFLRTLEKTMQQVESLHTSAEQQTEQLMTGASTDVHSTMIAVEKANLSFQLMMQVRNKIVQAYEEVSRMQF